MKQKKRMNTSTKVLIASIVAVVAFTVASFILQFTTGAEISSTLTEYWYKFWTTEIIVLSGIKVSKVFKSYHGISIENNEDFCEEFVEGEDE